MSNPVSLQESPEKKAEWLADAKVRLPPGTRVVVVKSDFDAYIGVTGSIIGYDIGHNGEWPMVRVKFDAPVDGAERDSFFADGCADDEVKKIEAP